MEEPISFVFDGKSAAAGRLDLYDASKFMLGAARVFSILGHYYQTGKIISQAPHSSVPIFILPSEEGSFKQTILATVVATTVAAPFGKFAERLFDRWLPPPTTEMAQEIQLLKEQNTLLRRQLGQTEILSHEEQRQQFDVDRFIEEHATECQVLRSIVASSTKDMFRPIGRSANHVSITHGKERTPIGALDVPAVNRLESDLPDPEETTVIGVVNSFSRSSKTGVAFSRAMGRGMLFSHPHAGRLPAQDDFSWSQFTRRPLEMQGRFVRWFDGSVKRFLVYEARRLEDYDPEEGPGYTIDTD